MLPILLKGIVHPVEKNLQDDFTVIKHDRVDRYTSLHAVYHVRQLIVKLIKLNRYEKWCKSFISDSLFVLFHSFVPLSMYSVNLSRCVQADGWSFF